MMRGEEKNCGRRRRSSALFLCALLATLSAPPSNTAEAGAAQNTARQEHEQHQPRPAARRYTRTVASYTLPDVTLTGMDGAQVKLASALDHDGPVLLQFIFTTCPTICPVMSGTFAATQDKFAAASKNVRMVSISIDPEHDTPERLRDYARKFKAGRQWLFLTGDLEDVTAVQKAFDAYRGNKMLHEPLTFLRASPGKPWVRLDGLLSGKQLLAEFKQLVSE